MSEIRDDLKQTCENLIVYSKGLENIDDHLEKVHKQADALKKNLHQRALKKSLKTFTGNINSLLKTFSAFENSSDDLGAVMNALNEMNEKIDQVTRLPKKDKDDDLHAKMDSIIKMLEENKDYEDELEKKLQQIEDKIINLETINKKDIEEEISPSAKEEYEINIGDILELGNYPQASDEMESIEWKVLDVIGKKILLLSDKALDCKQYNEERESTTWQDCTLRKWLNGEFYEQAFSEEEKKMIIENKVSDDVADNDAIGKVFTLSIAEAERYFASDEERRCQPTQYARKKGSFIMEKCAFWWLRSPGENPDDAADISYDGAISYNGDSVDNRVNAVRPALWVDVSLF